MFQIIMFIDVGIIYVALLLRYYEHSVPVISRVAGQGDPGDTQNNLGDDCGPWLCLRGWR